MIGYEVEIRMAASVKSEVSSYVLCSRCDLLFFFNARCFQIWSNTLS